MSMKKTHNLKTLLRAGALLAVAVSGCSLAQARTCTATWTGNAGDGNWNNAGNWSPRKVPGATSDVCIPILTTADGAGLNGSNPSISVNSIQVAEGGSLILGSGNVAIATALINDGFISLNGTTLSAASIDMPNPGEIDAFDNCSITSPAFSNTTGTVSVGATGTLRLADNPVQLQNGNLSGGNWLVAGSGVLVLTSDISQITTQPGAAFDTVLSVATGGALQDASGNNPLATLSSVGPNAVLSVASLALPQSFTSQGIVSATTLTVNGTCTVAGGSTGAGTLTAASVLVEPGGTLSGGTVQSSVTNNGTVSLSGSMNVTGNYTQAAGATLTEMFGATLHVQSNAALSGALNVQVNPKHPPASGASYTALTAGSLSGSFTSVTAGFTLTTKAKSIQVTKQ
jgi:hypothetical protein